MTYLLIVIFYLGFGSLAYILYPTHPSWSYVCGSLSIYFLWAHWYMVSEEQEKNQKDEYKENVKKWNKWYEGEKKRRVEEEEEKKRREAREDAAYNKKWKERWDDDKKKDKKK